MEKSWILLPLYLIFPFFFHSSSHTLPTTSNCDTCDWTVWLSDKTSPTIARTHTPTKTPSVKLPRHTSRWWATISSKSQPYPTAETNWRSWKTSAARKTDNGTLLSLSTHQRWEIVYLSMILLSSMLPIRAKNSVSNWVQYASHDLLHSFRNECASQVISMTVDIWLDWMVFEMAGFISSSRRHSTTTTNILMTQIWSCFYSTTRASYCRG